MSESSWSLRDLNPPAPKRKKLRKNHKPRVDSTNMESVLAERKAKMLAAFDQVHSASKKATE